MTKKLLVRVYTVSFSVQASWLQGHYKICTSSHATGQNAIAREERNRNCTYGRDRLNLIQANFVLIIMREMLNVETRRLWVTMNLLVDSVFHVKTKSKFLLIACTS